jgi:hypothetical protein
MRVTYALPLACPFLLSVGTVHSVQTLKVREFVDAARAVGITPGTVRVFDRN